MVISFRFALCGFPVFPYSGSRFELSVPLSLLPAAAICLRVVAVHRRQTEPYTLVRRSSTMLWIESEWTVQHRLDNPETLPRPLRSNTRTMDSTVA